jgi:hypothetical protein
MSILKSISFYIAVVLIFASSFMAQPSLASLIVVVCVVIPLVILLVHVARWEGKHRAEKNE